MQVTHVRKIINFWIHTIYLSIKAADKYGMGTSQNETMLNRQRMQINFDIAAIALEKMGTNYQIYIDLISQVLFPNIHYISHNYHLKPCLPESGCESMETYSVASVSMAVRWL